MNQISQAQIEVSHNLIYDVGYRGIVVGLQPGYIRDIFVHHNVIVGSTIFFGAVTDRAESGNFNVSRNIITNGSGYIYSTFPVSGDDGYRYPRWVTETGLAHIDENLIWTTGEYVAGYSWGVPDLTLDAWRAHGFDEESLLADPELNDDHQLPADSPYLGTYGRE